MKKITLFIAFLAISIGAVWGEDYPVLSGSTPNQYLPFDMNYHGTQHVQMIYPANLFKNGTEDPNNNIKRYKYEMNFIKSLTFTVNGTFDFGDDKMFKQTSIGTGSDQVSYGINEDCSITIKIAKVSSGFTNDNFIGESFYNPECTLTRANCSIPNSNSFTITIPDKIDYNSSDNLLIDIVVVFETATQSSQNLGSWNCCVNQQNVSAMYKQGNGSVTKQNTLPALTIDCSRKLMNVTKQVDFNEYKFDVFTLCEACNFTSYAVLKDCTFSPTSSSGNFYINPSQSYNNPNLNHSNAKLYTVFQMPSDVTTTIGGNTPNVTVRVLSSSLTGKFGGIDHCSYIFPSTITDVGDDPDAQNDIFYQSGQDVAIIFDGGSTCSLPKFIGNSNSSVGDSKIYVLDNCSSSITTLEGWGNVLTTANQSNYGWCSHPYSVTIHLSNKYMAIQSQGQNNDPTFVSVQQAPFNNNPLRIQVNSAVQEKNSDGTTHYYTKFNSNSSVNPADKIHLQGEGTSEVSATVNEIAKFDLYLDYYAEILNGEGTPTFKDQDGGISKTDVFSGAEYLIFGYNGNGCPEWRYTGDRDAYKDEAISVNTQIRVEKRINNEEYSYFSLPFDCEVGDIDVSYVNSSLGSGSIPLYTGDFITEHPDTLRLSKDYFVILEYVSQVAGNGATAVYRQVKNGTLSKFKGYAFGIVESDDHYGNGTSVQTIDAKIVFKSQNDPVNNLFGSTTYTGFSLPVTFDEEITDVKNQGWNFVGNPFYFSIKASSYGKYVAVIDQTNTGGKKVNHVRSDLKDAKINPFDAVFIQVPSGTTYVSINPVAVNDPTDPDNHNTQQPTEDTENSVAKMPEHLSVMVVSENGASDKTTVVNASERTNYFVIGDDMAKIMNPGIQIYSWFDSVPCAFKELPLRADSTMAIPLGVRVTEAGNYTFVLDTSLTFFYGAAMLHDKQMNQYHPLNEEGVQISLQKGTDNARFEVVIVPSEIPADVETVETSESLDAYVHDGRLVVENIEDGSTLSIFDVSGRMIYTAPAAGDFNYQFSAHGVYMVVLQGNTTGSIKVVY